MTHLGRALCSAVAVLTITACSSTAPGPTGEGPSAVFPVTLMRTGGVAGFRDVMLVSGDGLVSVTRKGQEPRQCQLAPEVVERLRKALSQVPWSQVTSSSPQPSIADDLVTTVVSPAGGPLRLADAQAGTRGEIFHELLNDLQGGPGASRLCGPR